MLIARELPVDVKLIDEPDRWGWWKAIVGAQQKSAADVGSVRGRARSYWADNDLVDVRNRVLPLKLFRSLPVDMATLHQYG